MDPNICRQAIVEHAAEMLQALRDGETEHAADMAAEFAYEVTCLNEWLDKGGFAPTAGLPWRPANDANMRRLAATIMRHADSNDKAPMINPGRIMAREITKHAK